MVFFSETHDLFLFDVLFLKGRIFSKESTQYHFVRIFALQEEMTEVMSRPLLRQLLHENKNMVSAHHRRPSSSCIDLTSTGADSCQPGGSYGSFILLLQFLIRRKLIRKNILAIFNFDFKNFEINLIAYLLEL